MAGLCFTLPLPVTRHQKIMLRVRCSSSSPEKPNRGLKKATPEVLKIAVSGVTELLRLFSFVDRKRSDLVIGSEEEEILVSGVDDVLKILKYDYENAYFVTGIFTSTAYAEDCIFEDPTISFRGKELYSRNLKLLVPFFDSPSIQLQNIEKGSSSGTDYVEATWKLRTYLKLPWKPLISISGSTLYELDDKYKISRHAESWNSSPLDAIGQIFTPSSATIRD